jgi:hypothetical protein
MSRYTRRLTSLRFEDAAGLGIDITPYDGDFSSGEGNAENAEHVPVMDRDQHDGFVLGADLVQDLSVTVHMLNQSLTHATNARILDFMHKRGSFASATSVDPTIWCWKAIATFNDGTTTATRTWPKCEGGAAIAVGAPHNTITITARNHLATIDT